MSDPIIQRADREFAETRSLGPSRWDWSAVERILVVRLRSIGDTVLATPSLHALRRFLPATRIDVLLEDWVAPVLHGFDEVDAVITIGRRGTRARATLAKRLRAANYDVAYNLHGGTTATMLIRASGARHRVGYDSYQYRRLYNHLAPSPSGLWGAEKTHSAEQQLALLGWTGIPVSDRPRSRLIVTEEASSTIESRLRDAGAAGSARLAVIHPAAAFETKRWAVENFARVAEHLHDRGFLPVVIAAPTEIELLREFRSHARVGVAAFSDLSLPEVTALVSRAGIFVGNDSGIAHIAAAVDVPMVVVFGSSNVDHWRPWRATRAELVREVLPCQPCPGYECEEFAAPECIRRVTVDSVVAAVGRVVGV